MSQQNLNSLAQSSSSYLRSAMHQPVRWFEWGDAAFSTAERENKPILLDIGAVWCHWCHVMDRESYEDADIAALINDKFIAVKVDRDERPDVDSRYQAAVSAIAGQGGWPLTVFLTSDGRPFFGGTYFPKDDLYGRPGFRRVLETMASVFATRKEEMLDSAASVMEAIAHNENFAGGSAQLSGALIEKLVQSAVAQYDKRYGGFGAQPKFPHPSALDLMIDFAQRTGDAETKQAVVGTLEGMAQGGMFDHLAGGFHRYSVDERWIVPHFEKMSYDNAGLLANYAHAYASWHTVGFAGVAAEVLRWMDEWLTDRDRGGFYASQDADATLEDDGDYFTWTKAEAAAVLTPDEMAIAGPYYDIGDVGDMHHDPAKNVLHVSYSLAEIARGAGKSEGDANQLLRSAQEKLYAHRKTRKTPYVDKTLYTNWNAMCISAYLAAGRTLKLPEAIAFALKTLDRILNEAWRSPASDTGGDFLTAGGLNHVLAYPDGEAPKPVKGMLEDYALTMNACIDAWEATGNVAYADIAENIARQMIQRFYDPVGDAFFDTEADPAAIGVLSVRRKPLQDSPTPSGNAVAALSLLRLYALTEDVAFRDRAEETLEKFAGIVEHFGLYAGTYGLALQMLLSPASQIVIVGEDEMASQLESVALDPFLITKSVVRLTREQITAGKLPAALVATMPYLPELQQGESFAVVCTGRSCLPPVRHVEGLRMLLATTASQHAGV